MTPTVGVRDWSIAREEGCAVPRKTVQALKPAGDSLEPIERDEEADGPRNTLAEFVAARREDLGMSQSELADRCGFSRGFANAIERGRIGLPSYSRRRALADALSVRHIDLLVHSGLITYEEVGEKPDLNIPKYPDLQRAVAHMAPATADALQDFIFFLGTESQNEDRYLYRSASRAAFLAAHQAARAAFAVEQRESESADE